MPCELQSEGKRSVLPRKLAATAKSPEGSKKNNFRSFIYGQSSTNPENFVKIGPVYVEIIGLTEITENLKKHQQNISPARLRFGWAN